MEKNNINKIISEKEEPSNNEKENIFYQKKENKNKNEGEAVKQKIKLTNNSDIFYFESSSYSLLFGKLNISMSSQEKKQLVNKYWIIKPIQKYEFNGNQIKTIWHKNYISKLSNLIGIFMVFKNFLTEEEFNRFDDYFKIIIKCSERGYIKNNNYGKLLYIGGDLKCELGVMIKSEFSSSNNQYNNLPLYLCIMKYNEYEKIELEAMELCDKYPNHNGFGNYCQVFHNNFQKALSNKVTRIINEKKTKKEIMKNKENENNNL